MNIYFLAIPVSCELVLYRAWKEQYQEAFLSRLLLPHRAA